MIFVSLLSLVAAIIFISGVLGTTYLYLGPFRPGLAFGTAYAHILSVTPVIVGTFWAIIIGAFAVLLENIQVVRATLLRQAEILENRAHADRQGAT